MQVFCIGSRTHCQGYTTCKALSFAKVSNTHTQPHAPVCREKQIGVAWRKEASPTDVVADLDLAAVAGNLERANFRVIDV
jgi:hypothetical protein